MTRLYSKFATLEDIVSPELAVLNRTLAEIHRSYKLPDHSEVNSKRYPWSAGMLSPPALYAARLWEYPFALLSAELQPGMKAADIGCGMTAFTIYLKEVAGCDVTGVDPDLFEQGTKYLGHGVSQEFVRQAGLTIVKGDFESIPLGTDSQDRVFSISVMEHVEPHVRFRGIQEIARILKPGGRAIITVDVSMFFFLNRPLDLVWDSGQVLLEPVDLRWPVRRFGMFSDGGAENLPADVFGMTLVKEQREVETRYRLDDGQRIESIPAYRVPALFPPQPPGPLWRRAGGLMIRELKKGLRRGPQ